MATKQLTQTAVSTTNVQELADREQNKATLVKQTFDKYGADNNEYINTVLLEELADTTKDNSGAHTIGFNTAEVTANNVGDALKEINTKVILASEASSPNVLINGNFDIWNRGSIFHAPNDVYTADRFYAVTTGDATTSVQRIESAGQQTYEMAVINNETLGSGITTIGQRVEKYQNFKGGTAVLSCEILVEAGQTYTLNIDDGDNLGTFIFVGTGTYQTVSMTKTIGSSITSLDVYITVSRTGSSEPMTAKIRHLKLEASTAVSKYVKKSYMQEVNDCKRYYQVLSEGELTHFNAICRDSANEVLMSIELPIELRAEANTLDLVAVGASDEILLIGDSSLLGLITYTSMAESGPRHIIARMASGSNLTLYNMFTVTFNDYKIAIDAEMY